MTSLGIALKVDMDIVLSISLSIALSIGLSISSRTALSKNCCVCIVLQLLAQSYALSYNKVTYLYKILSIFNRLNSYLIIL